MSKTNIYTMYATTPEALTEREEEGFKGGNFSKCGNYVIGDLGLNEGCEHCDHDLPVPEFLPSTYDVERKVEVDTGETEAVEQLDGTMKTVPVYNVETVIDTKPLTDTHPHYNNEQASYLVDLVAWSGEKAVV